MSRLLVLAWIGAAPVWPHDVITTKLTFSAEISRILYKRCTSCHQAGGAAPMSLLTYQEARPWAKAIKEEVLERRMPPWGAVKGFGEFRNEFALTQEEIHTIADWVEGGAPEGDPKYLPEKPAAPLADARRSVRSRDREGAIGAIPAGVPIRDGHRWPQAARIEWIRPDGLAKGTSLKAILEYPSGIAEPLLWIHNYDPRWRRTYYFRTALTAPPGSRLRVEGPGSVRVGVR